MNVGRRSKGSCITQSESVVAIIAAGGSGSRMSSVLPKQFLELAGQPILLRTLDQVLHAEGVVQVVIPLPARHLRTAGALLECRQWPVPVECVRGGPNRQESVRRAVTRARTDAGLILVHDAVRPLCEPGLMDRVLAAARAKGAAVPVIPATETIQRVSRRGRILSTPPREELHAVQTPQCFRARILRSSLERARKAGFLGTDESSVVRWAGHPVAAVPGSANNIKITHPIDLRLAELILTGSLQSAGNGNAMLRVGQGIDYHRLVEGRPLVLGGVAIPFQKGLEGHSDADVLAHAICDALLGAAAMGDIGSHFPDTDPVHRDRLSLEFLSEVRRMLREAGWAVVNVDAMLVIQRPRLAPFVPEMRRKVADSLGLRAEDVSIKATTTEGMNAEGRGEGISAQAVALIGKR
jgi:2-C-methyl-D-erythritol 4-phosphate cytidylyltransferase/2-C-methyl-D-erythritol 2,4-cyclodiphosphate synthase